jgi:hypothetical protein
MYSGDVIDIIGEISCRRDVNGCSTNPFFSYCSFGSLVIRTKNRPEGGCRLNSPPYKSYKF